MIHIIRPNIGMKYIGYTKYSFAKAIIMEISEKSSKDIHIIKGWKELHQESMQWNSDIELWKIEMNFFQKLLDKYGSFFVDVDQKMEIDHYQNLITYYDGELLDQFKQSVRRHENNLAKDFALGGKVNVKEYVEIHQDLLIRIRAFDSEIKAYKKEFFEFITKALEN